MFGFFTRSGDFSREDQNTGIKQFQKSGSDPLSLIFIRELIQNLIDAAISGKVPLLKFKIVKMKSKDDKDFIDDLFKETNALHKVNNTEILGDPYSSLVMEEFNTIGLTGTYDHNPTSLIDNHWSNFWFGQMRESKTGSKGGRRGVGKVALNMISGVRAVIAKTNRSDGNKDIAVGGRVEFEKKPRLENKDEIYDNFAMLTSLDLEKDEIYKDLATGGREALQRLWNPIKEKKHIKKVSDVFKFTREDDDFGTSWAIPAPLSMFDKNKEIKSLTNLIDLEKYILREFIWAIAKGSLRLDFGDGEINAENIEDRFKSLFPDEAKYFDFIDEVRTFNKHEAILINSSWEGSELDSFIEEDKKNIAVQKFDDGEMISFKFVAQVNKKSDNKSKTTNYYVHLKKGDESLSDHREEFYRNWLKISKEKKIKGKSGFVYAFVEVEDKDLCEFLAACEMPDHNNFSEDLGKSTFNKVRSALSRIRKSTVRTYELLNRLNPDEVEDLFSNILGFPEPTSNKSKRVRKRKKRKPTPPRPSYKKEDLVDLYITPDQVVIEPGEDSFKKEEMPKNIVIKVTSTYIFEKSKYFDLADKGFTNSTIIKEENIKVISKKRDQLELEVLDPDFILELDSFDSKNAFNAKITLN